MDRLRRHLTAFISVLAALMAMLFVATTALAAPPPLSAAVLPMQMSSNAPCDSDKAVCSSDCAVLCHVLVVPSPVVSKPLGRATITYSIGDATLRSLSPEAEDPPPR